MRVFKFSFLVLIMINTSFSMDTISWTAGVEETSKSNAELNSTLSSLKASEYDVNASRNGFLPKVSATAGYTYDSSTDPKNYTTSVNASENLFAGFSDSAKIEQAKITSSISQANLETVKSKISFDLKSAFMGLVYAQKYIKLTEDILARRVANLRLVQLRFETGRENSGSLDLSKAYLAQAKLDNLQAQNSKETFQSQLARVLGRDNGNEEIDSLIVTGVPPTIDPPIVANQKINFKGMVFSVPDYKKALFTEEFSKYSIDLSNSSFYPSLDLTQRIGRNGNDFNSLSSSSNKNNWSIGVAITFPLFNGGKDYYSSKSANENFRASSLTRKNTENVTVTKLKQAYTAYVEAVMKLEVDKAFAVAGYSRERIAKAQYNNGLLTFIDWDNIENDLINRQKTLLQSERDRVVAEAAWEQAQGKGVLP